MRPLRADPTRTTLIRRRFMAEMNRRFKKLMAAIKDFIDTKDALALREKKLGIAILAQPREFQFVSDPAKLKAFNNWLRQQIEADVLSASPGTPIDEPWLAKYIESAFKRGQINAYLSTKEAQLLEAEGIGEQSLESFLRSSFNQPETMNKIQLLATRAFENLKGVTATMSSQMNQILAQGMVDGSGAAEIASEMVDTIGSLADSRALAIARTETIAAHASGQLDAFADLGIDELGVRAEWSTAGDDRVCPECEAMEGQTFTVDEAEGLIPLHPNCVLGDSLVECFDALTLTRVRYNGKIIQINTLRRQLSVTEYHILLTEGGWRFAKDLREGDKLIDASSIDPCLVQYPNQDKGIPRIANVFQSLSKALPKHFRIISRTLPEDFHGDGSSMNEEVDVIVADCKLWDEPYSSSLAQPKKFLLLGGNIWPIKPISLNRGCPPNLLFRQLAAAADGFMSGLSVAPILARRPFGHHQPIGSRLSSNFDSSKDQPGKDDASTTPVLFSQSIQAIAGRVLFDEVVNVKIIEPVSGGILVFDVSTHTSTYALNGILSSNCRCTWIPAV